MKDSEWLVRGSVNFADGSTASDNLENAFKKNISNRKFFGKVLRSYFDLGFSLWHEKMRESFSTDKKQNPPWISEGFSL